MSRPDDLFKSIEPCSPVQRAGPQIRLLPRCNHAARRKEGCKAMEYCGVKYIAVKASTEPLWKWRILHTNKSSGTLSGEASDQTTAIARAHEAIGLSLRAECEPDVERHLHTSQIRLCTSCMAHAICPRRKQSRRCSHSSKPCATARLTIDNSAMYRRLRSINWSKAFLICGWHLTMFGNPPSTRR